MPWSLQYIGRALKLRKGESGSTSFVIIPDGSTDTINISVDENPNNLQISISPTQVTLDGTTNETINVSVTVPNDTPYRALWIIKISFAGAEQTLYGYIGILPVNESSNKVVLKEAEADAEGYWVGPDCIMRFGDYLYLVYRWRTPTERGHTLVIARSPVGQINFQDIKSFKDTDYGVDSFGDHSELIAKPDGSGVIWFPSILFTAEADTGIYKKEASTPEDLDLTGLSLLFYSKDPVVLYDSDLGEYIIGYSDRDNTEHDPTIRTTPDFSSYTTKVDGLCATKLIPSPNNNSWANYNRHLGDLHKVGSYYILFYDASDTSTFGVAKMGIAISTDLVNWIDLTPDSPIWTGGGYGAFRYVRVYCDDTRYLLVAEVQNDDQSQDMVLYYDVYEAAPPTPAEQMQEMVTTFIEQFIPLLINLMMLMIIMSLLTSLIERRK